MSAPQLDCSNAPLLHGDSIYRAVTFRTGETLPRTSIIVCLQHCSDWNELRATNLLELETGFNKACARGKVAFFSRKELLGAVFQSHKNGAGLTACGNAVAALVATMRNRVGTFFIDVPDSLVRVRFSRERLQSSRLLVSQSWTGELGRIRECRINENTFYVSESLNKYLIGIEEAPGSLDCCNELLRSAGFCDPATARMCVLSRQRGGWHARFLTCGGQRPHPSCPMTGAVVLGQLADLPAFTTLKSEGCFFTPRGREELPQINGRTVDLPRVEVELRHIS